MIMTPRVASFNRICLKAFIYAAIFCSSISCRAYAGDGIKTSGDILQLVLPAAAGGMAIGHKDRTGFIDLAESGIVTLGATYSLKYSINERRPDGGSQSFPSGHTSSSFCAAEFIDRRYGWAYGVPSFAIASFVGYSRVESKRHYTRDVIAGGAIGIFSSYLLTKPYKGLHVEPVANADEDGVELSFNW